MGAAPTCSLQTQRNSGYGARSRMDDASYEACADQLTRSQGVASHNALSPSPNPRDAWRLLHSPATSPLETRLLVLQRVPGALRVQGAPRAQREGPPAGAEGQLELSSRVIGPAAPGPGRVRWPRPAVLERGTAALGVQSGWSSQEKRAPATAEAARRERRARGARAARAVLAKGWRWRSIEPRACGEASQRRRVLDWNIRGLCRWLLWAVLGLARGARRSRLKPLAARLQPPALDSRQRDRECVCGCPQAGRHPNARSGLRAFGACAGSMRRRDRGPRQNHVSRPAPRARRQSSFESLTRGMPAVTEIHRVDFV